MLHYELKMVWGGGRGGKVPNTPKHNIQEQLKCPYHSRVGNMFITNLFEMERKISLAPTQTNLFKVSSGLPYFADKIMLYPHSAIVIFALDHRHFGAWTPLQSIPLHSATLHHCPQNIVYVHVCPACVCACVSSITPHGPCESYCMDPK